MLKEFETGDQIGEYTVLDKIAEGGMGIILKAQHRLMKRVVAIKISKLTAKNDELMSKMFRREIEASSHLSHPNVLTVFDAGMAGAQPYLVMEYLPSGDLQSRVHSQGPCSVSNVIDLMIQAADGLQAIHDCGIIHRDVKPANFIIDKRGSVQIFDFGISKLPTAEATSTQPSPSWGTTAAPPSSDPDNLMSIARPAINSNLYEPQHGNTHITLHPTAPAPAKMAEPSFIDHVLETGAYRTMFSPSIGWEPIYRAPETADSNPPLNPDTMTKGSRTQINAAIGTPVYMSPEQWLKPSNVDVRTDIYALGCTLFFLLTGEAIVDVTSSEISEVMNKKMVGETRIPSELRGDIPPGLDAIVRRMTAASPADRFDSMNRVKLALEQVSHEPHVFISYRREDSLDATDRLYTGLAETMERKSLFLDLDSIPAGVDFRNYIASKIGMCDVVLVVIGDYWLLPRGEVGARRIDDPADFVRLEIESALKQKVPIIPVLVPHSANDR